MPDMDIDNARPAQGRVFVVGLDGATLDLIDPWAAQGRLPNLAALMQQGSFGTLASTIPPISAPAWVSFMTGVNPGKHGIYHFQEHFAGSYQVRLLNGADVRAPTIWRILSEAGRRVISVNVAMTFPPEKVNGIVVAGVDAPGSGSGYTYPPELAAELEAAIGEYIIEPGVVEHCRRGNYQAAFDSIMYAMEQRFKAVEYLMQRKPWDLFVVNYRATDNIQHHFWQFMDPGHPTYDPAMAARFGDSIFKVYQRLDAWLGELRGRLDADTTLIVMSDHGAGPASPTAVYLNRWLAQQGWLTFAGQSGARLGGRLRAWALGLAWRAVWGYVRKWFGKRTKDTLRRLFPRLYSRATGPTSYFAIDWSRTRAYSDEFRETIWINLKGREPQGIVEPGAEYEALRDEIAGRLLTLSEPGTGRPIVEKVYRREEIYHGPYTELAPDLMLVLRQEPYVSTRLSHTTPSREPVQTLTAAQLKADYLVMGFHRPNGVLFMAGPNVQAGRRLEGAHITDLTPTILHLLGLPVPRHMDGRALLEALIEPGEVRYSEGGPAAGAPRQGYTPDEEEAVRQKLAGLGYLG